MSQTRKRRVTIKEYLNVHGCYVGGLVGSEDGYKLVWSRQDNLNALLEQTFPSRDDLLTAIDACLGSDVVAEMEQQRLQAEANIRANGGCLAIRKDGQRCRAEGKYFDPELQGLNCGMHPFTPKTLEEAKSRRELEDSFKQEEKARQHRQDQAELAEACTEKVLAQLVKEVHRLRDGRSLSAPVRQLLEAALRVDNDLKPRRRFHEPLRLLEKDLEDIGHRTEVIHTVDRQVEDILGPDPDTEDDSELELN